MSLKRFGVSLEDNLLESLDQYVNENGFANRSQAIRFLIENKVNWKNRAFSQFPRPYKAVNSYKNQTHMGYTVRTKNWRYTLWYDNATNHITDRELYCMNGNKAEKENLSGKREYVDIENELQQMIEEYKNTHNK